MSSHRSGRHGLFRTLVTLAVWVSAGGAAFPLDKGKALTQYVLDIWGSRDGLRQRSIHAITQTRDGYLWLATENGLVRFDGVRFTTFHGKNTQGFGHDFIHALQEGDDGSLWVGTYHGLTRLKDGEFTTYTEKNGLSDAFMWCLAAGPGRLWTGGWLGLSRFAEGRFVTDPRFAGKSVRVVLESSQGILWVGQGRSLYRIDGQNVTSYGAAEGLPHDARFNALVEARDGSLWIGTDRGLGHLTNGRLVFYTAREGLSSDNVRAIVEDRDGSLWVGTHAGLNRFDGTRFIRLAHGLTDEAVRSLFEDREGSLWVGTAGGGLNRLRDGRFTNYGRVEGVAEDAVWSVHEAGDGSVWIGTDGGGLNQLVNGRMLRYGTREGLPDGVAYSIAPSRSGGLWLGMNTALARFQNGRVVKTYGTTDGLGSASVRAVMEDSQGRLWVGTDTKGLYRREGDRFVPVTPPGVAPSNGYVSAIFEARDGSLWFGTDAGLWKLSGEQFTVYSKRNGLPGDYAAAVMEEADGSLWVGTNPGGVARFKDGQWKVIPGTAGLADDNVNAMIEDGVGGVWFSTDRAVYAVSKDELVAVVEGRATALTSRVFDGHDGLRVAQGASGFPAVWKGRDGRLWFATVRGAAVVDPKSLRRNPVLPPVYIEEVLADGHALPRHGTVEVKPGSGKLEVSYTAPSLTIPERVLFKYRLEGFESEWVDAGTRRVAYYTNIPPGRYRFRVLASNEDGLWNEEGAGLDLHLQPRFHQTGAFQGLVAMVLLAAAFGVHRLRVRQLKRREQELSRRVTEALTQVKTLTGLLPICSGCKKIRDDAGSWDALESYIQAHSEAEFTHGICPDCVDRLYPEIAAKRRARQGAHPK